MCKSQGRTDHSMSIPTTHSESPSPLSHLLQLVPIILKPPNELPCLLPPLLSCLKSIEIFQSFLLLPLLLCLLLCLFLPCRPCSAPSCHSNEALFVRLLPLSRENSCAGSFLSGECGHVGIDRIKELGLVRVLELLVVQISCVRI